MRTRNATVSAHNEDADDDEDDDDDDDEDDDDDDDDEDEGEEEEDSVEELSLLLRRDAAVETPAVDVERPCSHRLSDTPSPSPSPRSL
jgi:hypothetical protein